MVFLASVIDGMFPEWVVPVIVLFGVFTIFFWKFVTEFVMK